MTREQLLARLARLQEMLRQLEQDRKNCDPNDILITGEIDPADIAEGGDGIVYANSPEEAAQIRHDLMEANRK